jgi:hypothetical protein
VKLVFAKVKAYRLSGIVEAEDLSPRGLAVLKGGENAVPFDESANNAGGVVPESTGVS